MKIARKIEKDKNMPSIKKLAFMILLFLGIMSNYSAQAQIPNEIILSLKNGNSKVLSGYFNENVELVVLESDNVYSKAQAQQIVNNFFSNYKPESFTVIHQSEKSGAKYLIGNLVTSNGNFRVYFLLKKSEEKDYIHQLRIEKQE
jgi:hypothetical protein